jgi:hypothetical protein
MRPPVSAPEVLGREDAKAFRTILGDGLETAVQTLTMAIDEVARPIDAIKHQAKMVPVGIGRSKSP